jgi:hypothetical protein
MHGAISYWVLSMAQLGFTVIHFTHLHHLDQKKKLMGLIATPGVVPEMVVSLARRSR